MEIKITKRKLLKEVNCDMCHNYYYLVYGKIINDEKTKCKRFHFIEWFDIFDVMEYHEKESVSKQDIGYFLDAMIFSRCDNIHSFDNCKDFFADCNKTIDHYNQLIAA